MAQVRLILKDEVYGLGEAGDLVSVKPGYARNFLLPQGKAEIATENRVKAFEHHGAEGNEVEQHVLCEMCAQTLQLPRQALTDHLGRPLGRHLHHPGAGFEHRRPSASRQ